jgi:hypothetical protein
MVNLVKRGDGYVYRPTLGEHLLIALHQSGLADPVYALTETGAQLWEQMTDWTTTEALASALVVKYDVAPDQATADVELFLAQLRTLQAVEERAP